MRNGRNSSFPLQDVIFIRISKFSRTTKYTQCFNPANCYLFNFLRRPFQGRNRYGRELYISGTHGPQTYGKTRSAQVVQEKRVGWRRLMKRKTVPSAELVI